MLGGIGCTLVLPFLFTKAFVKGTWRRDPSSAILCAPLCLLLAGLLASAGGPVGFSAALAHALALLSVLSLVPVVGAMPCLLGPHRAFTPAMATCGFPMEVAAVALLRYRALLAANLITAADASTLLALVEFAAWAQLCVASLVVLVVLARFALAAARAVRSTCHSASDEAEAANAQQSDVGETFAALPSAVRSSPELDLEPRA